jgi:hypothetical protein
LKPLSLVDWPGSIHYRIDTYTYGSLRDPSTPRSAALVMNVFSAWLWPEFLPGIAPVADGST